MDDELLTVEEVARTMKVTRQHIYDLMRAGRLPYVQIGLRRGRRIRRSALEAFLREGSRGVDQESYNPNESQTLSLAASVT